MAQIKRSHKHTEADPKKHDAYTKKRVALNKRKFRRGGGGWEGGRVNDNVSVCMKARNSIHRTGKNKLTKGSVLSAKSMFAILSTITELHLTIYLP